MKLMQTLISLKTLTYKELHRILRIWPQTLLPPVITTVLYFAIFGKLVGAQIHSIQGYTYMQFIVPGLVLMPIITNSYMNTSFSFYMAKFQGNLQEILVSPMPSSIILAGYVLGGMFRALIIGAIVLVVATLFTHITITHAVLTFIVAVITAMLFSIIGLLNGIVARSWDDVSLIPSFVLTPLTYLGGVFYSLSQLPQWGQIASRFNPIYYVIDLFRGELLNSHEHTSNRVAFSLILSLTLALFVLALHQLRYSKKLRS